MAAERARVIDLSFLERAWLDANKANGKRGGESVKKSVTIHPGPLNDRRKGKGFGFGLSMIVVWETRDLYFDNITFFLAYILA